MLNVAVVYGGKSKEREVSLRSGKGIANALRLKGLNVKEIDFKDKSIVAELSNIDIVYIALHGKYGEDGRIQGLLDILEIPYVGSGVLASALAMNKAKSKRIFEHSGIRVAKDRLISKQENMNEVMAEITNKFRYPLVIKPNQEGSTIGLSIVNSDQEVKNGIEFAFLYDTEILVEEFVSGTEVTVAVFEDIDNITAFPVVEIIPNKSSFYDYESKYALGGSEHIVPARLEKSTEELVKKWAIEAHKQLGCETLSRVDFIIPSDGSEPVILEVNTLPGMTETSLYPDAARAVGLSYEEIVYRFVDITLKKYLNKE